MTPRTPQGERRLDHPGRGKQGLDVVHRLVELTSEVGPHGAVRGHAGLSGDGEASWTPCDDPWSSATRPVVRRD